MRRTLWILGLVGVVLSAVLVGRLLAPNEFNPSTTIKFGEVFEAHNEYGEDLLGELVLAPRAGHDGKFFFTQAMDPFYLDPDVHAVYLDRPTYRAQRMAYPTLASIGGLLSAKATAWGLIVLNILAMGAGSVYTGLAATRMGLSPWFGFAFLVNPGLIVDLGIDGAGILAMAGLMAAAYYVLRGSLWPAAVALSIAVLARETMLIAAVGLAAFYWYRKRQFPFVLVLPPFVSVVAWWIYLHWRLVDGLAQDTQALDLPLVGFVGAFNEWLVTPDSAVDLAVGCLLLITSILILLRALRTPSALGWSVAGFAMLALMLSEPVWEKWFDSTRALAPVLTAYILLVPSISRMQRSERPAVSSRSA